MPSQFRPDIETGMIPIAILKTLSTAYRQAWQRCRHQRLSQPDAPLADETIIAWLAYKASDVRGNSKIFRAAAEQHGCRQNR
jgi:hypothetical protein